jgi:hypothetical protein
VISNIVLSWIAAHDTVDSSNNNNNKTILKNAITGEKWREFQQWFRRQEEWRRTKYSASAASH